MNPSEIATAAVKLLTALVGLYAAVSKLAVTPAAKVEIHKVLMPCFWIYLLVDIGYYLLADAPRWPIRVVKIILVPVAAVASYILFRDYKAVMSAATESPAEPPGKWALAVLVIASYLVIDVAWCFKKGHYDKWAVGAAAALIGFTYAWLIL